MLVAVAATGFFIGALGTAPYFGGMARAAFASALDAGVVASLIYLTLSFAGYKARFVQTATAVFGIGVLFGVALLPLALLGMENTPLAAFIHLIALAWSHVAIGHVLRNALEMDLWAGIVIAVGYTLVSLTLISTYLPATATTGG